MVGGELDCPAHYANCLEPAEVNKLLQNLRAYRRFVEQCRPRE